MAQQGVGRPGKVPDIGVHYGGQLISVEVKAPYVELPIDQVWAGDNREVLAQTLDQANRQFAANRPNILLIVTNASNPVFGSREELVRAFFADELLQIISNRRTGEIVQQRTVFAPRGKFLKLWGQGKRNTHGPPLSFACVRQLLGVINNDPGLSMSGSFSTIHTAPRLFRPICAATVLSW